MKSSLIALALVSAASAVPATSTGSGTRNGLQPAPARNGLQPGNSVPAGYNGNMVSLHNAFRSQHAAPALVWNATLAYYAQKWAQRCIFEHSHGQLGPYGENLAAGYATAADAFGGWTTSPGPNGGPSEEQQYNPSNPVASHYTQVVWKSTTSVGCYRASCNFPNLNSYSNTSFDVCEYYPQGNLYLSGPGVDPNYFFERNVSPSTSSQGAS